jgi:hypothetical protein
VLADMVRTHAHELRPVAGDSPQVEAVKVVARTHKTPIWERTRHIRRLRHALRDCFPAALAAFTDLDAADTLELPAKAPTPARAARLTIVQISGALKRARRKDVAEKAGSPSADALALLGSLHAVDRQSRCSAGGSGAGDFRAIQRDWSIAIIATPVYRHLAWTLRMSSGHESAG